MPTQDSRAGRVAEGRAVSDDTAMLSVRGLTKSYRLGDAEVQVLRGIDLTVAGGEIVAVMGPSGIGKTTLLNCISAIDTPDAGEVLVGQMPVDFSSENARTLLRRDRVGVVFQFFNLVPTLTARENVALPFLIAKADPDSFAPRVTRMLASVGLEARADHYPRQLSGGEMQLVSVARALVHSPNVLLADEPTGNVNPAVGRRIMGILRRAARDARTATVLVTHSPEHAAWADRVCFLKDGVIAGEHLQEGREHDVAPLHERLIELGI